MKNDLDALKIRCDNEPRGCKTEMSLGALKGHLKEDCGYVEVSCTNAGCKEKLSRCDLEAHLLICEYQAVECSKGCGMKVSLSAAAEHNCVSELRKVLDKQQLESEAKLTEMKQDMESRLDSHRVHMVYKEATLQNQIEDLKSQVAELLRETKNLHARETAREMQRKTEGCSAQDSERKEVLEWLRGLKYQDEIAERFCSSCNKRYLYVRKETLQTCSDQVRPLRFFKYLRSFIFVAGNEDYVLCYAVYLSLQKNKQTSGSYPTGWRFPWPKAKYFGSVLRFQASGSTSLSFCSQYKNSDNSSGGLTSSFPVHLKLPDVHHNRALQCQSRFEQKTNTF